MFRIISLYSCNGAIDSTGAVVAAGAMFEADAEIDDAVVNRCDGRIGPGYPKEHRCKRTGYRIDIHGPGPDAGHRGVSESAKSERQIDNCHLRLPNR